MYTDTEKIARAMYDAYCSAVGGKAWNGQPLPKSDEFFIDPNKKTQADGWRASARVAKETLTQINRQEQTTMKENSHNEIDPVINDTQPLPTPSDLQDQLTGFFSGFTKVTKSHDGTLEICLPLMTTASWQPIILVKQNGEGTFEIFARNDSGGKFFFPTPECLEGKISFFFGFSGLEQTSEHGYTLFCSRDELPVSILRFGLFLQSLYFARKKETIEAAVFQ